ncbi:MAG: hypothetical protein Q4G36_12110 [Paracoccus sp. (in: a-proteobacteria)]|nr:hypothetical protein [Paracoccus sp. (in: a-proteobacteria)]
MLRPLAILAMLTMAAPVYAADPDWPCVAGRRDHLSMGQMWAGPAPDEATAALARDPAIRAMAEVMTDRRAPLDDLLPQLDAFAEGADNAQLTALFQAAFDLVEDRRYTVVSRIAEFVTAQRGMQAQVEQAREALAEAEAADPPDFDAIDRAEERRDITARIFEERQRQIRYVCEVPNLLEQRAFGLARAIMARLD